MPYTGDVLSAAQARWPHLEFKRHGKEWHSPCPWCGGEDRFVLFTDGGYWCRNGTGYGCGRQGWVDDDQPAERLSPEERRLREIERRQREMERKQEEQERRLTILEQMARQWPQAQAYHVNLDVVPGARDWWQREGLYPDWQDYFNVGYCGRCPTDTEGRASYTIPVIDGGELVNIRHRIVNAPKGDKYRPHMAGLGASLFNADALTTPEPWPVLLVEGEKKAMVLSQYNFTAVAIAGCRTWKREWTARFAHVDPLYIVLDPDAMASAEKLAGYFPQGQARIVALPCKPDDFFSVYRGNREQFMAFVEKARRV